MKPRIKRTLYAWLPPGFWDCWDKIAYNYGASPEEAYQRWSESKAKIEAEYAKYGLEYHGPQDIRAKCEPRS